MLLNIVGGERITEIQEVVFDVNGDGEVSTTDYTVLLNYLNGGTKYLDMLKNYSQKVNAQ